MNRWDCVSQCQIPSSTLESSDSLTLRGESNSITSARGFSQKKKKSGYTLHKRAALVKERKVSKNDAL